MRLIIATENKGKLVEIKELLNGFPVEVVLLSDYPGLALPPETGETFKDNALAKARYVNEETGELALADDSGLIVDALGGAPGVYSARYAGEGATDEDNNEKLLREMAGVEDSERACRFRCAIALSGTIGGVLIEETFDAAFEGVVGREITGRGGFGYDPLFFIPELGKTSAELAPEEKNRISHRGKALVKFADWLRARLEVK